MWKTKLFNGKETNVENLNKHKKFLKQIMNILRKSNTQDKVCTMYALILEKLKFAPETIEFLKNFGLKLFQLCCFDFNSNFLTTNPKFRKSCQITESSSGNNSLIWRYFWKVAKVHSFLKQSLVFKSMIVQTLFWKRMDFRFT